MTAAPALDILLVEDNEHDAELTLRALKKHRLASHIHWTKDGAAALDYLLGSAAMPPLPRVILLDLKLPKVDGLEVLRRLKSDDRTKSIPVVVLTSSNQESDLLQSYQLGVNSYLVKPVEFDSFSETVAQFGLYWLRLNQLPQPGTTT